MPQKRGDRIEIPEKFRKKYGWEEISGNFQKCAAVKEVPEKFQKGAVVWKILEGSGKLRPGKVAERFHQDSVDFCEILSLLPLDSM
jgi:hypothetical protein